jgi:hypothetical protein
MRTLLLAAIATTAIAAPAVAETTGSVGVQLMNTKYDYGFDYDTWSIDGSVFHRISGPWAVQAQAHYEYVDYGHSDVDHGNVLALHGLYQTDAVTAGLFLGQGGIFGDSDWIKFWGAEGAYRFGNWSVDAYAVRRDDGSYPLHRYGVDAKYYFGDNISVGAGYARQDYGVHFDDWKINAEYRLSAVPLTLTGGYYRWDADNGSRSDDFMIGIRWDFGSSTLREHDRTAPIVDLNNYVDDIRRWD